MGMFDYLYFKDEEDVATINELLEGHNVDTLSTNESWQTKSLENCMTTYIIKDKKLYKLYRIYSETEFEIFDSPIFGEVEHPVKIDEYYGLIEYHGAIEFHGWKGIRGNAHFNRGLLESIEITEPS